MWFTDQFIKFVPTISQEKVDQSLLFITLRTVGQSKNQAVLHRNAQQHLRCHQMYYQLN